MFSSFPILLAKVNEVVSVLVGLAFFVIWVINQINDAKKKQAAQEQKKKMEAMQPAGNPNAAPAPPPADPLRAQVDEFLRRAGKQPAAARPQPKTQKPAGRDEVVVLLDESAAAPPPRKTLAEKMRIKVEAAKAQRAKPTASQIPRTQPPRPQQRGPSQPRPQTVVEHVTQHVGSASEAFRQEVADLGQSVRRADEQFDVQLHQKFDHELGSLGHSTGTSATTEAGSPPRSIASPAGQIAAMLANPEGIRQAIILNEILHRPSDRW
jgi:hypothetical protein